MSYQESDRYCDISNLFLPVLKSSLTLRYFSSTNPGTTAERHCSTIKFNITTNQVRNAYKSRLNTLLLRIFGVKLATRSSIVRDELDTVPFIVGRSSSSQTLAYYLSNYNELVRDTDLADFMTFYCEHSHITRSQWSQDIWVMYESHQLQSSLYLEIGGADGYTHSNTLSLEQSLGWSGTILEPEIDQYRRLCISRPNNKLINAALSPTGVNCLIQLRSVGQLSSALGFEGDDIHKLERLRSQRIQHVPALPLQELLANECYHYFSLDIEGAEYNVLSSVDWSQVNKPRLITVEHNYNQAAIQNISLLLQENGYVRKFKSHDWLTQGDLWFALSDL